MKRGGSPSAIKVGVEMVASVLSWYLGKVFYLSLYQPQVLITQRRTPNLPV